MTVKIACVVFDCHDALVVGRFWSAAIGRPLDPAPPASLTERNTGTPGHSWLTPEGNEFDLGKAL